VTRGQRDGSLRPYSRLSRPEPLLFHPSSTSVVLTRLSGPRSRPTTFFLVVPGNRTRDLRNCSQELWPLDHRCGLWHRYIFRKPGMRIGIRMDWSCRHFLLFPVHYLTVFSVTRLYKLPLQDGGHRTRHSNKKIVMYKLLIYFLFTILLFCFCFIYNKSYIIINCNKFSYNHSHLIYTIITISIATNYHSNRSL
jgi:hypothetical protein